MVKKQRNYLQTVDKQQKYVSELFLPLDRLNFGVY